jgi:hypothetical protein
MYRFSVNSASVLGGVCPELRAIALRALGCGS